MWTRLPERIEKEETINLGGFASGFGNLAGQPILERPFRYIDNNTGLEASFHHYYNTILLPAPNEGSETCQNRTLADFSKQHAMRAVESECGDARFVPQLGLLYRIHAVCSAVGLKTCHNPRCITAKDRLTQVIPRCSTWPGFTAWALQLASCICSDIPVQKQGYLAQVASALTDIVVAYQGTSPPKGPVTHYGTDDTTTHQVIAAFDYVEWAESVDLADLLFLLPWLRATATGIYEPVLEPPQAELANAWDLTESHTGGLFTDRIERALARAQKYGLCPHRIWAVASNLPGRELNLPSLVPDVDPQTFPITSHGIRHKFCTFDSCEESSINFTNVTQLHRCSDQTSCSLTGKQMFSNQLELAAAAENSRPTAWNLDGLSIIPPQKPYMAISHIWADGTGVGIGDYGRVNVCLYNHFRQIASDLKCEGFWWDTVCIPSEKKARIKAINDMHNNYSQASTTLVHDLYLCETPWINAESAAFAIVMSPWFTRGWTALELAKSRRVKIIFRSLQTPGGFEIKDLDDDILAKPGEPCTPCHQVVTMAINALRRPVKDVNELLVALGPRYTSWTRDRAIITALLAGISLPESASLSQHEIYLRAMIKLGKIYDANLFHEVTTPLHSWCPRGLYDMPVADSGAEALSITDNGDVVGYWSLLACSPFSDDPLGLQNNTKFVWPKKHSLTESLMKMALRSSRNHIILVERHVSIPTRGLLVKVMKQPEGPNEFAIRCQYVGALHFRSIGLERACDISARLGYTDGLEELDGTEMASNYVMRLWEKRNRPVIGRFNVPMGSVGPIGIRFSTMPWEEPDDLDSPTELPPQPQLEEKAPDEQFDAPMGSAGEEEIQIGTVTCEDPSYIKPPEASPTQSQHKRIKPDKEPVDLRNIWKGCTSFFRYLRSLVTCHRA